MEISVDKVRRVAILLFVARTEAPIPQSSKIEAATHKELTRRLNLRSAPKERTEALNDYISCLEAYLAINMNATLLMDKNGPYAPVWDSIQEKSFENKTYRQEMQFFLNFGTRIIASNTSIPREERYESLVKGLTKARNEITPQASTRRPKPLQ